MAGSGRRYLGRVLGNKTVRITVGLVASAFAGVFWLLTETGLIEPGPTVAVIGVALFVILAAPVAFLVGGAAEKKVNADR